MTEPSSPPTASPDEDQALARVTEALRQRFPQLGAEEIAARVDLVRQRYVDAPIRDFVAVMIEREVTASLRSAPSA